MLYNQPLATRFGTDFITELQSSKWNRLDVAVAWVRQSALGHLTGDLENFLKAGHKMRFVVGIDLLGTSKEGLEALLALEASGDCTTFIFHNEAASVFHPKVYLFRKGNTGKLIVGSNNLTGAGLFQNTEAGLAIVGPCSQDPIKAAQLALTVWMDTSSPLVRQLNSALLVELEDNGYIISESAIRARHRAHRKSRDKARAGKTKLFGSAPVPVPSLPTGKTSVASKPKIKSPTNANQAGPSAAPLPVGKVLLLRPRLARGTQAQIPLRILKSGFFKGQLHAKSIASGVTRPISFTFPLQANGKKSTTPNTAKIELPEAARMTDPVVRFVRTKTGIEFEVWDGGSAQGTSIKNALAAGLSLSPPRTILTVPSKPASSTWWRFI